MIPGAPATGRLWEVPLPDPSRLALALDLARSRNTSKRLAVSTVWWWPVRWMTRWLVVMVQDLLQDFGMPKTIKKPWIF